MSTKSPAMQRCSACDATCGKDRVITYDMVMCPVILCSRRCYDQYRSTPSLWVKWRNAPIHTLARAVTDAA